MYKNVITVCFTPFFTTQHLMWDNQILNHFGWMHGIRLNKSKLISWRHSAVNIQIINFQLNFVRFLSLVIEFLNRFFRSLFTYDFLQQWFIVRGFHCTPAIVELCMKCWFFGLFLVQFQTVINKNKVVDWWTICTKSFIFIPFVWYAICMLLRTAFF